IVNIRNPRVSGNIETTTQNALLGADVTFQANVVNASGGSYSWSFSGQPQVVGGGINQSSVTIRWTQTGAYAVSLSYTVNGATTSPSLTVNVIVPTLSDLRADMIDADQVTRGQPCSDQPSAYAKHSLGCASFQGPQHGIIFNARADIPAVQYLSDPAQSGIKFRHFGSEYSRRKMDLFFNALSSNPYEPYLDGREQCLTGRTSRGDIESGWQSDGGEVFNGSYQPLPRF